MGVQRLGQLFWLAGVVFFLTRCADARPFRGAVKWSFLLCKFSDAGTPPRDRAFYVSMFLGSQGLPDFFSKVTYNSITLDGSDVRGWYTMPVKIGDAAKRDRGTRMNDCINAAKSGGYTPPTGNLIAVITYPSNDLFGWPGWGAYFPYDASLGAYGHELGHGIGFEHSFSNDPAYRNADWAMIGEYDDPWDAMSYAHVYGTSALRPEYGDASPSYNAYHMDRMGWLPRTKVYTFGMKNETDATYMIEATNTYNPASTKTRICTTLRKCPPAYLMVRIPFDFNDRYHYYTVSLRLKTGYDAGIPYDQQFLIHEVKRFEAGGRAWYSSVLVRDLSDPAKRPATSLSANGVTISLLSKSSDTATVRIQSSFALRCKMGYVWRDARPGDTVCVTPDQRTLTWQENALADSRREPNGGAYGPNTCKQGYVWREAYAGDLVCVTPDRRTFNRNANAAASSLIDNKALSTYGPNTCKSGFVWREADNRDWVCVSPAVRTQARLDNAAKSSRRKPGGGAYGPNTCMNGFVWRDAFPGDYVCVVPSVRSQARTDNGQAPARLDLPMA